MSGQSLHGHTRAVGLAGLRFGNGFVGNLFFLGLNNSNVIGKRSLGSGLTAGIPGQHNFDLDAQDTLSEQDVSAGCVDVVVARITTVDHQSIDEFHSFGSLKKITKSISIQNFQTYFAYLSAKLAGNDDFATLGSGLHDEPEHTVASTTHGQTTDELVPKGLGLCNSAKTTSGHLLGVQFDGVLREAEPLLHDGGQFTDPPTLFTQDVLGAGGHDDDFGLGGSHTDLDTGVTIFSQLTSQELVQFGLEHAIGDKLEVKNKSLTKVKSTLSKDVNFSSFHKKLGL